MLFNSMMATPSILAMVTENYTSYHIPSSIQRQIQHHLQLSGAE